MMVGVGRAAPMPIVPAPQPPAVHFLNSSGESRCGAGPAEESSPVGAASGSRSPPSALRSLWPKTRSISPLARQAQQLLPHVYRDKMRRPG